MKMYCITCKQLVTENVDDSQGLFALMEGHEGHDVLFSQSTINRIFMEVVF